jgi:hypothetical protein
MEINQAQLNAIAYALTLAQYFVDEQDPSNTCHASDTDTLEMAYIALHQIQSELKVTA